MQDFCCGMLKLLQGVVDVQSALRCTAGSEFMAMATQTLGHEDGQPEGLRPAQFVPDFAITLGAAQVCRLSRADTCHAGIYVRTQHQGYTYVNVNVNNVLVQ